MGGARDAGELRKVEQRYDGYDVVDIDQDKIGSVDATYVNESNQREYIAVSAGALLTTPRHVRIAPYPRGSLHYKQ